jgi:hypothetical protein
MMLLKRYKKEICLLFHPAKAAALFFTCNGYHAVTLLRLQLVVSHSVWKDNMMCDIFEKKLLLIFFTMCVVLKDKIKNKGRNQRASFNKTITKEIDDSSAEQLVPIAQDIHLKSKSPEHIVIIAELFGY